MHAFDNYSMYRAGEVSVHRAWCERATQPYLLGGWCTVYPVSRPAGVTTRSPRDKETGSKASKMSTMPATGYEKILCGLSVTKQSYKILTKYGPRTMSRKNWRRFKNFLHALCTNLHPGFQWCSKACNYSTLTAVNFTSFRLVWVASSAGASCYFCI